MSALTDLHSRTTFDAVHLPLEIKEAMCEELIAEAGAAKAIKNPKKHEIRVTCLMPWHDDHRPTNAFLNYEKLVYICFACQSSGGLLWLISQIRGGSTRQAKEWLGGQLGDLDTDDVSTLMALIDSLGKDESQIRAPIPSFSTKVLEPWAFIHPWLTDPIDPDPEVSGRGIPEQNVIDLRVGYAEEYPMGKDIEGNPLPPSERIVVPHFWKDKLVGWQSRRLCDDGTPKWLSTADFPRDTTIFNLDRIPSRSRVVVVESPMSVLRHTHHLPIVATFGSYVSDTQVRLLAQFDEVIYWPDPDEAGFRSVRGWRDQSGEYTPGLIERLEPYTDLSVVETDWAVDPADLSEDDVTQAVEQAPPAALWEEPTGILRCHFCRTCHTGECDA